MYTLLCAIIKGRRSAGGLPKERSSATIPPISGELAPGSGASSLPLAHFPFVALPACPTAPQSRRRSLSFSPSPSLYFLPLSFLAFIFLLLGSCFSAVFISEPFLPSLFPSLSIRGLIFSAAAAPSIFSWGRGRERGPLGESREVRGSASGPARTHNSFLCALNDAKRAPGASSSRHLPPSRRTQQCALTIRSRRVVRAERS